MDHVIGNFNSARQANIHEYQKIVLKVRKVHTHIIFNKTCLKHKITPNYAKINIKNKSIPAQTTQNKAQIIYIKENIKHLYKQKDELNFRLYKLHLKIAHDFGSTFFTQLATHTENWVHRKTAVIKRKHNKKIAKLIPPQSPAITPTHTFYPRIVNLTNVTFTNEQKQLLNKGINHNLHYTQNNNTIKNMVLDTETGIQQTDIHDHDNLRWATHSIVNTQIRPKRTRNTEIQTARSLRQIAQKHNLTFTKADKGNTTVIMHSNDLKIKVHEYITDNGIKQLDIDPTDTYHKTVKQIINGAKHIITNAQKRYLKQIHPTAPTLQALPKIHKTDIPIRPVINYQHAPAHKLAKHMDRTLRNLINIDTKTYIKNSTELINRIKNVDIPHNSTLASFDIKNLYTNIPITETLSVIENLLKQKLIPKEHITEIINILSIITKQNYFTFNNKFYTQPEGLPMGSPISSILAEIFLQHIEHTKILSNNKHSHKIIYWYRYVDDILLLFRGNTRQCEQLLTHINKIHTNLHFTAEYENNRSTNFLDLTITKDVNQKHSLNIYRKPTMPDTLIHSSSNHPIQHKHSAFVSMIHRLLNTPLSTENYNVELNTIKYMAQSNGYNPNLIDTLLRKIKNRKRNTKTDDKKYITLTYINNQTNKIAYKFKKAGYNVAFRTNNKTKQTLTYREKFNDAEKFNRPGVYKLNCADCNKFYIGQTGRNFKQRYREHLKALTSTTESSFANHLMDTGHNYNDINTSMEILHVNTKGHKLNTLEQYEIYRHTVHHKTDILNEQTHFKSNTLFDHIINLSNRNTSKLTPTNTNDQGGSRSRH